MKKLTQIQKPILDEFQRWMKSDNVVQIQENLYVEQCSQYRIKMTKEQMYNYFVREFINV